MQQKTTPKTTINLPVKTLRAAEMSNALIKIKSEPHGDDCSKELVYSTKSQQFLVVEKQPTDHQSTDKLVYISKIAKKAFS
jgi:hypothetical protein